MLGDFKGVFSSVFVASERIPIKLACFGLSLYIEPSLGQMALFFLGLLKGVFGLMVSRLEQILGFLLLKFKALVALQKSLVFTKSC